LSRGPKKPLWLREDVVFLLRIQNVTRQTSHCGHRVGEVLKNGFRADERSISEKHGCQLIAADGFLSTAAVVATRTTLNLPSGRSSPGWMDLPAAKESKSTSAKAETRLPPVEWG
jgi:hypothetical protein